MAIAVATINISAATVASDASSVVASATIIAALMAWLLLGKEASEEK
jgi:hypothetical protein